MYILCLNGINLSHQIQATKHLIELQRGFSIKSILFHYPLFQLLKIFSQQNLSQLLQNKNINVGGYDTHYLDLILALKQNSKTVLRNDWLLKNVNAQIQACEDDVIIIPDILEQDDLSMLITQNRFENFLNVQVVDNTSTSFNPVSFISDHRVVTKFVLYEHEQSLEKQLEDLLQEWIGSSYE